MQPNVQAFFDPATFTASYLVSDPVTKAAAIIDPVLDYDPKNGRLSAASTDAMLKAVADQGLELLYTLETHAHADHLSAGDYIRRKTGAKLAIGAHIVQVQKTFIPIFEASDIAADGAVFDLLLEEGDTLPLGNMTIGVMHTPGHTAADVTYVIENAAFVGDTLFMPDYGTARTDFPGGDARALYASIRKILTLPDDTRIFVGHDYLPKGRGQHGWESSVVEQRRHNIMINASVSEDAFVAARKARDATLAAPVLLLPALQVNIRAGALPPATASGKIFLRVPVTPLN